MVGDDKLAALADWKANNSKELTRLQHEHEERQQQVTKLEQENKQHLTELNRVLTEKDGLSKMSMEQKDTMLQQERAKTGLMMASMSREQLEDANRQLEEQLAQVMEQKDQCSIKLKRAKDVSLILCAVLCLSCIFLQWFPEQVASPSLVHHAARCHHQRRSAWLTPG